MDDEPVPIPPEPPAEAAPEPTSEEERAERKRIKREKRAARRKKDAPQDEGHPGSVDLSTVEANREGEGEGRDVQDVQEKDEEARKRRKKEKKKARKATETATGHPRGNNQEHEVDIQEGKDDQDVEMQNAQEEHRPKKRRKVAFVEEADLEEQNASGDDGDDEKMEEEQYQQLEQDPDEGASGFLPTFPRPKKPRAPSASVLYRQGLDKALAQAEIVDSSSTLPLKPPEIDGMDETDVDEFGLTQRMRKRLGELEITELFAGNVPGRCLDQRVTDLEYRGFSSSDCASPLPPERRNPNESFKSSLPTLRSAQRRLRLRTNRKRKDLGICCSHRRGQHSLYILILSTLHPSGQILSTKVVTRLRALIVLPTRELAAQVYDTLESVGRGRHLKVWSSLNWSEPKWLNFAIPNRWHLLPGSIRSHTNKLSL